MYYRKAELADWEALWEVRMSVKENVLINTSAVTYKHYESMLAAGGQGWVCEVKGKIVGFSIVDIANRTVWALFVLPEFANMGIGRTLHHRMLDWSFRNGAERLQLSTEANTRAEYFYRKAGWQKTGINPDGEVMFEIGKNDWLSKAESVA